MSASLKVIGKYLDQPLLVEKLRKTVPVGLSAVAAVYTLDKTMQAQAGEKKKTFVKPGEIKKLNSGEYIGTGELCSDINDKYKFLRI